MATEQQIQKQNQELKEKEQFIKIFKCFENIIIERFWRSGYIHEFNPQFLENKYIVLVYAK